MVSKKSLSGEFHARELVDQVSHPELWDLLDSSQMSFYAGFDPTAPSLQLGNFYILMHCLRLLRAGHCPHIVLGGATGMIGDPSGKSQERNLLSDEVLLQNIENQTKQFEKFLDLKNNRQQNARLLNNIDWVKNVSYLHFLRDIGKHFKISEMVAKDSVKSRLENESGISYTEFSYQILQAFDFYMLNKNYRVTLQIGGSDQWGNMTAGIDLIRKITGKKSYVFTFPLLTDKDGKKFGKSEGNALYLDENLTPPYKLHQFFLNTDDAIVTKLLKQLTFLDLERIEEITQEHQKAPHQRLAQRELADTLTKFIHGEKTLDKVREASKILFGGDLSAVTDELFLSIASDIPMIEIPKQDLLSQNLTLITLLSKTTLFSGNSEIKRSLKENGVYLNNKPVNNPEMPLTTEQLASPSYLLLRKGKKNYFLVHFI